MTVPDLNSSLGKFDHHTQGISLLEKCVDISAVKPVVSNGWLHLAII